MLQSQSFFRQNLQEGAQRPLNLPKCAEDGFFEGSTRTREVRCALWANEDELAGDEPRQFTNVEDARGRAVIDHRAEQLGWNLASGVLCQHPVVAGAFVWWRELFGIRGLVSGVL